MCSDEELTLETSLSYTPNLTGVKHTISTIVDQTHIQLESPTQIKKKPSFLQE